jgi:hypothetical protein
MSDREERMQGMAKQSKTKAEGQHGSKTHSRLLEELHSGEREEPGGDRIAQRHEQSAYEGKRRLVEDREQHDEAERNSEKVRLTKDLERGSEGGPSDNTSSLHGVLDHREHRADHQARDNDGFRARN